MKRRSLSQILGGLVAVLALGVGWLFFGPSQFGGSTSYAVVVGSSMEPLLHRGDLAIIRTGGTHVPGDVALYESDQLGARVLHRIQSSEDGRFVLKGDKNDFVDTERPTESQIVGELWVKVPYVGTVTEWVGQPSHSALVVGLATLLALGGGAGRGRLLRRRRRPTDDEPRPKARPGPVDLQPYVIGIAGLLALSTVLLLAAFTRPTARVALLEEAYVQQARFDYSADVPANVVYPDGRVTTGEPIFLRLVPRLRVAFAYALQSRLPLTGEGRIGLVARLADGRGWERRFVLARSRAFTGRDAKTSGILDLRQVQRVIEEMSALTGSSQAAYTMTILPSVTLTGRLGEAPLSTTFGPTLGFDLGDLRLQPNLEGSAEGVSPFAPREAGNGTQSVANELSLGALALRVETARVLGLLGLLTGVLLGLLALGSWRQRGRGDEADRIATRYSHLLLPVTLRPPDWTRVTELGDMESLVRLAEHHDRMILHLVEAGEHSFVVEEATGVYRYRTGTPDFLAPIPDLSQSAPQESRR
ncbi:MAG: signal peptidase I [Actinobacteria bacterium]|nr:signal peptidase I [Actinomycetota bacterium]